MDKPVSREDIRRVFPEVRETTSSGHLEYNVSCPFGHRKGSANFKMYVNAASGVFHCCDCGESGNFWTDFVTDARRGDGRIAAGKWASKIVRAETPELEIRSPLLCKLDRMPLWANGVRAPGQRLLPLKGLGPRHPATVYMRRERRLDPDVFGDPDGPWKACYCEDGIDVVGGQCTTSGRIIIPFYSGSVLRGWTARKIEFRKGESEKIVWNGEDYSSIRREESGAWPDRGVPKYFHMPAMNKSTFLYNMDQAQGYDTVWAFEGPLDVWAFGGDAVCYNGEFPSAIQCRLLSLWTSVRWGMDPEVDLSDKLKSKRHKKVLEQLQADDTKWRVLSGGDPADLGREEVERQFEGA